MIKGMIRNLMTRGLVRVGLTGNYEGELGSVDPNFRLLIQGLAENPTYGRAAQIGDTLVAVVDNWSEEEPGSVSFTWNNVLGTPSGNEYTPVVGDNLEVISVTATPSETYDPRGSSGYRVRYSPPQVVGSIGDQSFEFSSGNQTIDVSTTLIGGGLTYGIIGPQVSIDSDSGEISLSTDTPLETAIITVTAMNSGGTATLSFEFKVLAEESDWILDDGTWNDDGIWDDESLWRDTA